jgi:aminoglycoside phosphotransferase (APT) family kinase protein
MPELLGRSHAALHALDPAPLIDALAQRGIGQGSWGLDARFGWLEGKALVHEWVRDVVEWLIAHRPPEPKRIAVCHDDFHPLNILVEDGRVTGVLDWPGFLIADPALDVADTLVLIAIPTKHLGPALGMPALASVDTDLLARRYLDAYRAEQPLDGARLEYYRARRCVHALIQGAEGQAVWQHPGIVGDLVELIRGVTGIEVAPPAGPSG